MKTVDFFGTQVSKLILGDNPVHGHSYIGDITPGSKMMDYYNSDNYLKLLKHAEELGINSYLGLANDYTVRIWRQYIAEGGKMNLLFQTYPAMDLGANIVMMKGYNPVAIYHQGGTFDYMLETGQKEEALARIRKLKEMTGLPIGICSHVPEVILQAEEEDWGADFYMTCLYNARKEQRGQQSGFITGKSKSLKFYPGDKYEMFKVIQKVQKPCLVFKLLAGDQVLYGKDPSEYEAILEKEFRDAYENMKPQDIGVIGVYQEDSDQLAQNVRIINKILEEME